MGKRPLESSIEAKAVKYARGKGIIVFKMNSAIGEPDRQFLQNKRVLFVEFKRPGEKPRPKQVLWMNKLSAQGFTSTWVDNFESAKKLIDTVFDNET